MFEKLSEKLGVDIDKVVLNKDEIEKGKLSKVLKKNTFKERTRLIEEKDINCPACNGKGFYFEETKGYEEECIACNGTGKEYSTPIKEKRNCWDCGFYKEYINRRKMEELNTDNVIYYHHCENQHTPSEILDLKIADKCPYYDDDSWMK